MESKKNSSPHVLVLPYPGQGHINPMLQFSKRLLSKGIHITQVNTLHIANSSQLAHHQSSKACPINFDTISDGFDQGGYAQAPSADAYLSSFRSVGSQTLSDLIRKLNDSGRPVDALVYDGFLPWALDVAKKFGLLGVVFFTQTCAVNTIYYHVHQGLVTLPTSSSESVLLSLDHIPGFPLLESWEAPNPREFFDLVVDQFSNVDQADLVLFNTFDKLEQQVIEWLSKLWKVRTIGPTLPSMYLDKRLPDDTDYGINMFKPNSVACMDWLKDKANGTVVYVSFGSLAELEPQQMEEIAWGLKDGNFNFLWVVRASEAPKLPNKFIEETSDKGLVVTWSPQLEILANDSIGCFVTHCGLNSVLEAISLGVPLVALPQWTDQPVNAKYVEEVWGVGLRAKHDDEGIVRRQVLVSCIEEVLHGEKGKDIKKNALEWKTFARQAVDEGGSSDNNIQEFADELFSCIC